MFQCFLVEISYCWKKSTIICCHFLGLLTYYIKYKLNVWMFPQDTAKIWRLLLCAVINNPFEHKHQSNVLKIYMMKTLIVILMFYILFCLYITLSSISALVWILFILTGKQLKTETWIYKELRTQPDSRTFIHLLYASLGSESWRVNS